MYFDVNDGFVSNVMQAMRVSRHARPVIEFIYFNDNTDVINHNDYIIINYYNVVFIEK